MNKENKLKNKTSKGKNTFEKIQQILAENGAKKVIFDYSRDGKLEAISFALEINGTLTGFRLPAMVDNVFQMMYGKQARLYKNIKYATKWREQAYITAWANIRDWIDAQMALVKTRQVKVEQVFLPYMVGSDNKTLYERFENNPGLLLGNGN